MSDGNGGLYIKRTSIEKWAYGIVGAVIVVVASAGIMGLFSNALATRDNTKAINDLVLRVDKLVTLRELDRDQALKQSEDIKLGLNSVKVRLTAIDKKVD